jgi:RimJ/RimL family protein N-acetyltransferase/ADP-ribose pyrophosphatase YjhB (NUDIX family)
VDPSAQPTLRDGDLLLRPWRVDDVATALLLHDEELSRWLGRSSVVPSGEPLAEDAAEWVGLAHRSWTESRSRATFLVEYEAAVAGSVELQLVSPGVGVLWWAVYEPYRRRGLASRAVRLLVDYAFTELGLSRVEAHVHAVNRPSLGVALRSGLRREGLLRSSSQLDGVAHDTVVLGRLRDDPAPGTREGFTGMLDSVLPVKRAIAQGVMRNEEGDVLLCELAYKREWDLPGGVVDPNESPAQCVVREIHEELGLTVHPVGLLAVDWMPPWLGWRDAVLLVFDLGTAHTDLMQTAVLEAHEIRAVHWADEATWTERVAPYTARLLRTLDTRPSPGTGALYLEDGRITLSDEPRA